MSNDITRMPFKAAIFDLDGTLLDSMHIWEMVDEIFLGRRGISVPHDYPASIRAMSFKETADYTIERFELDESPEEVVAEWMDTAYHEYAERVELKAGAAGYLRALKEHGTRIASASSLHRDLARAALEHCGIAELFDVYCWTDEVDRGKERPDIFLLASERLSTDPAMCIVFEDILPAAMSAKSAGMKLCCVSDPSSADDEAELRSIADIYIDDFYEAPLPSA